MRRTIKPSKKKENKKKRASGRSILRFSLSEPAATRGTSCCRLFSTSRVASSDCAHRVSYAREICGWKIGRKVMLVARQNMGNRTLKKDAQPPISQAEISDGALLDNSLKQRKSFWGKAAHCETDIMQMHGSTRALAKAEAIGRDAPTGVDIKNMWRRLGVGRSLSIDCSHRGDDRNCFADPETERQGRPAVLASLWSVMYGMLKGLRSLD